MWAHGVVLSHPLHMRKALGSIPGADKVALTELMWWSCYGPKLSHTVGSQKIAQPTHEDFRTKCESFGLAWPRPLSAKKVGRPKWTDLY
eukprot:5832060-Amphidinium_carterae.2